jgi:alpha-beta hydrolase superfamily lysophospholipase
MKDDSFRFARGAVQLHVHRWQPAGAAKAVVQIAHGMAEHGARYARFASALTAQGYAVYADDHRGHGQSCGEAELGHFAHGEPAGTNGWQKMVEDLVALAEHLRAEHPGLPLLLVAHSMGTFLTLDALVHHGPSRWDKVVLSGSDAPGGLLVTAGRQAAKLERLRLGPEGKSALLEKLSFGAFNDAFKPARTAFDWLSRDAAEVDRYVADPRCGFPVSTQSWVELTAALSAIGAAGYRGVRPRTLPIFVLAGATDPVGKAGAGVKRLVEQLRTAGLTEVEEKLYPGGRHEMLNETNRDEVTADVLAFLGR